MGNIDWGMLTEEETLNSVLQGIRELTEDQQVLAYELLDSIVNADG